MWVFGPPVTDGMNRMRSSKRMLLPTTALLGRTRLAGRAPFDFVPRSLTWAPGVPHILATPRAGVDVGSPIAASGQPVLDSALPVPSKFYEELTRQHDGRSVAAAVQMSGATGVIVTGGGSGIGRACARRLAAAGRPVAAWDLDGEGAATTIEGLEVAALSVSVDVSDPNAVSAAIERSRDDLGSIGGFVHAAGILELQAIDDLDLEVYRRVLEVNLVSFASISQQLLPDLRASGTGAIVGVASLDAFIANPFSPAYASSKAGLLGLVRSMATGLGADGIRVNAVCPGFIDTPMLAIGLEIPEVRQRFLDKTPLGRIGQPDDIAKVAAFLLSDDAGFVTGQAIVADGGVLVKN